MSFKILHTADWHLGKIFYERSLEEDQKNFIGQLFDELEKESKTDFPYDALVIAGDVYDTANPSSATMKMLDDFYIEVTKRFPALKVFISKGNHDSIRIGFNKTFLGARGIHLCADTENFTEPVVMEKEGESLAVYMLPYLNQMSKIDFAEENEKLHTQSEIVGRACELIKENHSKNFSDSLSLVCAHLTTFGSIKSGYDENTVGTIDEISSDVFSGFDYTALGHIHKMQKCSKDSAVYYSGSPLQYYFDSKENENCFLKVVLEKNSEAAVEKINIRPLHKVERFEDFIQNLLDSSEDFLSEHRDNFIEVIYKDEVIPVNSIAKLKSMFPNAVSFRPKERESVNNENVSSLENRAETFDNPEKYFDTFYSDVFGDDIADKELHEEAKKLFIEIANRIENDNGDN